MRRINWGVLGFLALTGLVGCGVPTNAEQQTSKQDAAASDSHRDHRASGSESVPRDAGLGDERVVTPQLLTDERTADARARVLAVAEDGREITLDHGPLDAIGMGAMTMAFDVAADTDVTVFGRGDLLEIRVKQHRNYTYELVAACRLAAAGEELSAGKDQNCLAN